MWGSNGDELISPHIVGDHQSEVKQAVKDFILNLRKEGSEAQGGGDKCHVCSCEGVSLTCGKVIAPVSTEVVGVVLQTLLCVQDNHEGISSELWLCENCSNDWKTLSHLFFRMEELRVEFNYLRRKVGRQVILESLGRSEEGWKSWDLEVTELERSFPPCVGRRRRKKEEEARSTEEVIVTSPVHVKEERLDGESELGDFLDFVLEDDDQLETLEHEDKKLNMMTPRVILERIEGTAIKTETCEEEIEISLSNELDMDESLMSDLPETSSEAATNVLNEPQEASSTRRQLRKRHFESSHIVESETSEDEDDTGELITGDLSNSDDEDPSVNKNQAGPKGRKKLPGGTWKQHPCFQCHLTFRSKRKVANHVQQAHKQPPPPSAAETKPKRRYQCQYCPKSYGRSSHLWTHRMASHSDIVRPSPSFAAYHSADKKPKCSVCSRVFCRVESLRRHEKTVHSICPDESKILCTHCDMTFGHPLTSKKHLLWRHFLGSTANGDSQCPFCLKFFPNQRILELHQKDVHFEGQGPAVGGTQSPNQIRCFICKDFGGSSLTPEELEEHERSWEHKVRIASRVSVHCNVCKLNFNGNSIALQVHLTSPQHQSEVDSLGEFDQTTFCVPCRENFESGRAFSVHKLSLPHLQVCAFRENATTVTCPKCPEVFVLQSILDRHIIDNHTPTTYNCQFCEEVFGNSKDLAHHRRTHADQIPKEIVCEECGKRFELKSNLERHMKLAHEGNRSTCSSCDKTFPTGLSLEAHVNRVHPGRGKKSGFYSCDCPHCDASFKKPITLRKHLHDRHPDIHRKSNPDTCTVCFHSFPSAGVLCDHMKSHAHLKCQTCLRYLPTRHHLQIHMRSHTGEKPFKCNFCVREYQYKSSLTEHLMEKHGDKE